MPAHFKQVSERELEQIRRDCQQRVKRMSWVSAGAAVIPVPLFDVVVDIGVLVKLVPEINRRFGLEPEQIEAMPEETRLQVWKRRAERGSELIGMVVTRELIRRSLQGMGTRIVAKQVTKFIPLGGQIVAATLGYWVMRKLAMRHIDDCFEVAATASGLYPQGKR
ncbi:YcjF family protein [Amnimonas aquatica]|uniref:YcjF family protein n=1 Tax=Amnimonas aquatica TaxID=2094561 RepID=UPI001F1530F5|nr:YcjF family protein [Amnimonas aquatica]